MCEVRIISILVTTQRYASSAEEADVRYNNFIFTIVFLLLALDDDMWLPAFLVVA